MARMLEKEGDRVKAGIDISRFRHPSERAIWMLAVVLNAVICLGTVVIVLREGAFLFATFPALAGYEGQIRGVALAAVLAPPLLVLGRNRRFGRVRGQGIRVTATQYGPLHARFLAHCDKLGISRSPHLYVSDAIDEPMRAHSAWRTEYVVVGTDYLESDLHALEDVWSFLMGRELGRLVLGHVRWWDEMLLAYVGRLPWVRRPLRHARTFSIDAIAAFVEPQGVRALVIEASGRRVIPATNVAEQIRYARSVGGFWVKFAGSTDERPMVAIRLQMLYDRGFFDLEHDLQRFGGSGER